MSGEEGPDEEKVLSEAIRQCPFSIILTDPRLHDNPIVYVNDAFQATTLFSREYALGRNCRFLQGPETDPDDIERIRKGLDSGSEFEVEIINHKADGTPFRNLLLITPVHGSAGELTAFFGLQRVLPESRDNPGQKSGEEENGLLRELQHRVKNHLSMIVSMIRVEARREVTAESLGVIGRRVEALALLYEELLDAGGGGEGGRQIDAGAYLKRIATVISGLRSQNEVQVNVACSQIILPIDQSARLGLLLSEFLTNALEHAFEGQSSGRVDVGFFRQGNGTIRLKVADDGNGIPEGVDWPSGSAGKRGGHAHADCADSTAAASELNGRSGMGGSIAKALIQSLGATLNVSRPGRGTLITIDFEPGQ